MPNNNTYTRDFKIVEQYFIQTVNFTAKLHNEIDKRNDNNLNNLGPYSTSIDDEDSNTNANVNEEIVDELLGLPLEDLEELLDEAANNLEEDNDDMAPPTAANLTPVRPPKVNNNPKRALKEEEYLE